MDSPIAQVEVASAWSSKINWTQFVGGAAMLLTFATGGKVGLNGDQQAAVATTIGLLQAGVTWFLRTYKTTTVTPGAVASTPPNVLPIVVKILIAAFLLSAFLPVGSAFAQERRHLGPVGQKIADDMGQAKAAVTGQPADPAASLPCTFQMLIKLTPSNLLATIKQCIAAKLVSDTQRALESANNYGSKGDGDAINCLTPALEIFKAGVTTPAVPEMPAVLNPDGSVKTPAVPAVPAQDPGPILLYQKYREFTSSGALTACQAWFNGPINATAAAGVAGIGTAVGAAAIFVPK